MKVIISCNPRGKTYVVTLQYSQSDGLLVHDVGRPCHRIAFIFKQTNFNMLSTKQINNGTFVLKKVYSCIMGELWPFTKNILIQNGLGHLLPKNGNSNDPYKHLKLLIKLKKRQPLFLTNVDLNVAETVFLARNCAMHNNLEEALANWEAFCICINSIAVGLNAGSRAIHNINQICKTVTTRMSRPKV